MRKTETYARVIDFIPPKSASEPLLQLVGEDYFILFSAEPMKNNYRIGECVYIGRGPGDNDAIIVKRIRYGDLTGPGRTALEEVLRAIITEKESFYVDFFNYAPPITNRMHTLELLPGIGKKNRDHILEERRKKKFTSFKDVEERAKIHDPAGIIVKRIVMEMRGADRHRLFYGKNKLFTPENLEKLKKYVR